MNLLKYVSKAVLVTAFSALPITAQSVSVKGVRGTTPIPRACESAVPANIEGNVDIKALVNEANCKGSGDILSGYTYVLKSLKREKKKSGQIKEETRVYEVFIPILPSGTRADGVLLVTSRNGVPVPSDELERERVRAGERLEKEEKRAASLPISQPQITPDLSNRVVPVGTYSSFGFGGGSAAINIHTFLTHCEFAFIRREQIDGREMLVLSFTPESDAQFSDKEKYLLELKGMIWIDAKDRIVTRMAGWPGSEGVATEQVFATQVIERVPAVYFEIMRLPAGIWLPMDARLNGANYPKLFNGTDSNSTLSFSEYKRFTTEIEDLKLKTSEQPL